MLEVLKKSRQLAVIVLDRISDYMALLRIEMKLQGREFGVQVAGYLAAAVFALFALFFIGIAIIISFWDSDFRALAAWLVVALYAGGAAAGIALARRHAGREAPLLALREEMRRDFALVRESL
jgi:uncharacterized membrane protein YqjE